MFDLPSRVNTAIILNIVTPFTATITGKGGLIPKVYAIFFSDMVFSTVLQVADSYGQLERHVLAPRSKCQDEMNLYLSGSAFELAERYTNMTKSMFLALWYCSIYPGA